MINRPPIEFGIGFHSLQSTYVRPRLHSYLLREAVEEARRAEDLGFDSIWLGSHHFSYDGYCPSPIPALAHIAAGTKRIIVGSGILLFSLHTPEEIARQCEAFHDAFSDRRLRTAMAAGYVSREFLAHQIPFQDRGRVLDENVGALLGEHGSRFGSTELWVGGSAKPAFRRAARNGASLLLGEQFQCDELRNIRDYWESELTPRPGQHHPRITVLREIWPEDNPRMCEWYYQRLREEYRVYELFAEADENINDKPAFRREGAEPKAFVDSMADMAIIGSTDKIVDQLGKLIEAGADGFAFRMRVGSTTHGHVIETLERLATSVLPQLRRG